MIFGYLIIFTLASLLAWKIYKVATKKMRQADLDVKIDEIKEVDERYEKVKDIKTEEVNDKKKSIDEFKKS